MPARIGSSPSGSSGTHKKASNTVSDQSHSQSSNEQTSQSFCSSIINTIGNYPLPTAGIASALTVVLSSAIPVTELAITFSTCTAFAAGAFITQCYYKVNYESRIGTQHLDRSFNRDQASNQIYRG